MHCTATCICVLIVIANLLPFHMILYIASGEYNTVQNLGIYTSSASYMILCTLCAPDLDL